MKKKTFKMIIATWNINGIRTTLSKTPLKKLFQELGCDVICLQETKITGDYLDGSTAIVEECNSYFSHSKVKSGYSGVAIFAKNNFTPVSAEEGLTGKLRANQNAPNSQVGNSGDDLTQFSDGLTQFSDDLNQFSDDELLALDGEGRCLMTEHIILDNEERERKLVIINVYCPRADPDRPERLSFKLRFYQLLQIRAEALLKSGRHVVIAGDINTIHKPIDHCDPASDQEFMEDPGRQWMDGFLRSSPTPSLPPQNNLLLPQLRQERQPKFVDLLRLFEPKTANLFTNWCSTTGARATNYGCRLDYIFADIEFASTYCTSCYIRPDIMGSDHCPVVAHFNCRVIPAERCPPLCSKYLPQFAGKQTKLSTYFVCGDLSSSQESCSGSGRGVSDFSSSSNFSIGSINDSYEKSNKHGSPLSITNNKRTLGGKCKKASNFKTDSKTIIKFLSREKLHANSETHSTSEIKTNFDESVDSLEDTKNRTNLIKDNLKITATSYFQSSSLMETKPPQSKPTKLNESWGKLLKGPPKSPYCTGHNEPCVLRTVKKEGPNKGKQFWVCCRPEGHKSNPAARCDYFLWIHGK
ncbi:hypothetical protein HELRODRAFT_94522 [Helobdella robusta]|uniref:DNA-(apurinic or apyrimidinic site) endonuclease 2 n=1 Tax=Helobdella robusta TaxID=6412 RepID=T1G917_HELRO|nr:hypothetical protein HELRODRAFT_94522 [Helobdella robusta]ESO02359.1 hypothetical protein HELRODRAFT_94522 [Helobdella robusta]